MHNVLHSTPGLYTYAVNVINNLGNLLISHITFEQHLSNLDEILLNL
jgi:hypothetical protein